MKSIILLFIAICAAETWASPSPIEYENMRKCIKGLGGRGGDSPDSTVQLDLQDGHDKMSTLNFFPDGTVTRATPKSLIGYWSYYNPSDKSFYGEKAICPYPDRSCIDIVKVSDARLSDYSLQQGAEAAGRQLLADTASAAENEKLTKAVKDLESSAKTFEGGLDGENIKRMASNLKATFANLDMCDHVPDELIKKAAAQQRNILNAKKTRVESLIAAQSKIAECISKTKAEYDIDQPPASTKQ